VTLPATLDLLRHGDTGLTGFRGSVDDPLTTQGWQQMRATVEQHGPWQAVVSSPLSRCAAFARKFSQDRELPLHLEPRLRELHFGLWEGRSAKDIWQTHAEALSNFWKDPYQNTPPHAEPLQQFEDRVLTAWQDIHQRFSGQGVLVITHAGVIRMLLTHLHGLPSTDLLHKAVPHASLHRIPYHLPSQKSAVR